MPLGLEGRVGWLLVMVVVMVGLLLRLASSDSAPCWRVAIQRGIEVELSWRAGHELSVALRSMQLIS